MGYLQDKLKEAEMMLNFYKRETSVDVCENKLKWQKQIASLIENDNYDGMLDISDWYISVETEMFNNHYDETLNTLVTTLVKVVVVKSCDGKVYVEDENRNEYFIDDIDEGTFKRIFVAVLDLTSGKK